MCPAGGIGVCVTPVSTSPASVSVTFAVTPSPPISLGEQQRLAAEAEQPKEQQDRAKAEKQKAKEQRDLAKAKELFGRLQIAIATIETKLANANTPKDVARLKKQKEEYSMVLTRIQGKYSVN